MKYPSKAEIKRLMSVISRLFIGGKMGSGQTVYEVLDL
jgi:hypothetical protein